ncbi:MAG: hypothetical protein EP338_06530 [Bacteroidetes bacterium]|nr:MAG: hypothetical protein EP338_06530 [Bacteroidota bacterium]
MKWIRFSWWVLFSLAVLAGMVLSRRAQDKLTAKQPEILIRVDGENNFLTEKELHTRLKRKALIYPAQSTSQLPLNKIEHYLLSMSEVREANVYKHIGNQWNIDVALRKPIARIYNQEGQSYYLDDRGVTMKISPIHTARVPIVSGAISDQFSVPEVSEIINNDSLKTIHQIDDIYRISNYVCNDPFLSAQISQIHRLKNGDYMLIPQVGDHTILFGKAYSDRVVEKKFKKLILFYKEGLPYEGWNKYSEINLKYNKQLVCTKKKI